MSVTLREVIEYSGYDLSVREDAEWLVSKKVEFEELLEQAEDLIEAKELEEAEELADNE